MTKLKQNWTRIGKELNKKEENKRLEMDLI